MSDYKALLGDGRCVVCQGPLGHLFVRLRIDRGIVNVKAAQRLQGLAMFLGSDGLADVFSPYRPDEVVRFTESACTTRHLETAKAQIARWWNGGDA